jgi:hypothetical protein
VRGVVVALVCLLSSASLHAQRSPLFLEPGHWTWDAIRRLSAAGLAPANADPAEAPITVQHARAVFRHAAADTAAPGDLAALAEGWARRLAAESDSAGALARLEIRGGWMAARGEARGGEGYFQEEDWVGARPIGSANGPAATITSAGHLGRHVSWSVHGGRLGDQWRVPAASVAAALGPLDVWAGRRRLHYGAGRGGGLVLGTGFDEPPDFAHRTLDSFDGVGLHVREPFDFPGFLRVLGPARIEVVAGRMESTGLVESPWVVFGRLTGTPFGQRFMLGVNRGAVFGGTGRDITLRRMLGVLVGDNDGAFENQIISAVMRYRPPLGALPLELYFEFGADDLAGGFKDVPAYVAGFDLAAVPGVGALAIGGERTSYSTSCCGNPPWYRHVYSRGSWSDRGRLFAHPLGGNGREWRAHARLDLPEPGVQVRADVFARDRRRENLFSPERQGSSRGTNVGVEYRSGGWGVRADGSYEKGDAWSVSRAALMLTWLPLR